MRVQRMRLSREARYHAAQAMAKQVVQLAGFARARRIAIYVAMGGECDPAPLKKIIHNRKKSCYLPILSHQGLRFAPATPRSRYKTNDFRIPEPRHLIKEQRTAQQLDLIVLPLVAFDAAGHRIGMGGGFYDRALAFTRQRPFWRRPLLIGLAYDFQRIGHITPQPWDIALDAIVTPSTVFIAKRRR